ncbi:hypothetical protein FWH58_00295 [Candidatus Saccharibacteria bacterium]|nr:hypothetical protein [Candidatus Saccharibacteria bacterium]
MDVSTLFSEDNASASSAPADSVAPVGGSAAIDADSLLGAENSDPAAATTPDPTTASPRASTTQIGDPLAGTDDSTTTTTAPPVADQDDDIIPNETIATNDWSKVGETRPPSAPVEDMSVLLPTEYEEEPALELPPELMPPAPAKAASEPELTPEQIIPEPSIPEPSIPEPVVPEPVMPEPEPAMPETTTPEPPPFASELKFKMPGVDDPDKVAFVKTYTEEFDEALRRATEAARSILEAIDKAVHEHSPSITVPNVADEFLIKKPPDGKVERFEDAREIVNEVLARAADAKAESARAAAEAARIYDEVQAFKQETEAKIVALTTDQPITDQPFDMAVQS